MLTWVSGWRIDFESPWVSQQKILTAPQLESFASNWHKFEQLMLTLINMGPKARVKIRIALEELLAGSRPLEQNWFCRILQRDLKVGVSGGVVARVWPELELKFGYQFLTKVAPTRTLEQSQMIETVPVGMRVLVVVYKGRAIAYSGGSRCYPLLEAFTKQLERVTENGVFDGFLHSPYWPEAEHILNCKTKSVTIANLKRIYYGLKLCLIDYCSLDIFSRKSGYLDSTPYFGRRRNLETLYLELKRKNKRTSISLSRLQQLNSCEKICLEHPKIEQSSYQNFIRLSSEPYLVGH